MSPLELRTRATGVEAPPTTVALGAEQPPADRLAAAIAAGLLATARRDAATLVDEAERRAAHQLADAHREARRRVLAARRDLSETLTARAETTEPWCARPARRGPSVATLPRRVPGVALQRLLDETHGSACDPGDGDGDVAARSADSAANEVGVSVSAGHEASVPETDAQEGERSATTEPVADGVDGAPLADRGFWAEQEQHGRRAWLRPFETAVAMVMTVGGLMALMALLAVVR